MGKRIRKGDLVQVNSGKQRGQSGRVLVVDGDRVRVEGVRMQKRHLKAGRAASRTGGIVEQEGYIHISNVALVEPSSQKPSRVKIEEREGKRVRVFVKSGELVPQAGS